MLQLLSLKREWMKHKTNRLSIDPSVSEHNLVMIKQIHVLLKYIFIIQIYVSWGAYIEINIFSIGQIYI